jgi:hypothetical protein
VQAAASLDCDFSNPVCRCLQDECRSWDVNEIVFSPALWPAYHHLMRSDFQLFDEYVFEHEGGRIVRTQLMCLSLYVHTCTWFWRLADGLCHPCVIDFIHTVARNLKH